MSQNNKPLPQLHARIQNPIQHSRVLFGEEVQKQKKDDPGLLYLDLANKSAPRQKMAGKPKLEIYVPGNQKQKDEIKPNQTQH